MNGQYFAPDILISAAVTIIVGALGILIGHKLRPQKKPVVSYSHTLLQSSNHPKVKILYDDEEVVNLHAYNLVFWNHGSIEIRKEDIPYSNGPHFQVPENSRILSVAQNVSDSSSNAYLEVSSNGRQAFFKFDFLNPKEGISAQILYSALSRDKKNAEPTIGGSLVGAANIVNYKWPSESKFTSLLLFFTFLFFAFVFGSSALVGFSTTLMGVIGAAFSTLFAVIFLVLSWVSLTDFQRAAAPRWVKEQIIQLKKGKAGFPNDKIY